MSDDHASDIKSLLVSTQMRAWNEGVRDGMKQARDMSGAIKAELEQRLTNPESPHEADLMKAQLSLVTGMIRAFAAAVGDMEGRLGHA